MENDQRELFKSLQLVTTLGVTMIFCIGSGFLIGYYLDRWLETSPVFLLLFLIVGVAVGFWRSYKLIVKVLG